jgi:hypothetical protein
MKMKIRLIILNTLSIAMFMLLTLPNLVGQNSDSLRLEKVSQHFNFYATRGDMKVLDSLAVTLEKNYTRITNHLGIRIDKKISVQVFPDLTAFHLAIHSPNAPDWVVGTSIDDKLMMVSPRNPGSIHTYNSLMQVVVHEFVHVAVYYARGGKESIPLTRWLSEGYAEYEAGQVDEAVRRSAAKSLADKEPPAWSQLENASAMEFGAMNGYALSGTIVEFLVDTYGIDKLVLLIKEPEKMESIYGIPQATLEKQWVQRVTGAAPKTNLDSIVSTIIDISAKDFVKNQKPAPVDFINVCLKYIKKENGEELYILCGQFRTGDKQEIQFATVKNIDYEQWIGTSALTYCQNTKEIPYTKTDLSAALKSRFEALSKK